MIKLTKAENKTDFKNVFSLYKKAFPKSELKPIKFILKMNNLGINEILTVKDEDNNFCGLIISIFHKDMVLLDYFAIKEDFQNKKIGSQALQLFLNKYANKRIIIEIENTSYNKAKNILQRIRRKNFYLKNGLEVKPFKILLFGEEMEILTNKTEVNFEEYFSIFQTMLGNKKATKKIKLLQ